MSHFHYPYHTLSRLCVLTNLRIIHATRSNPRDQTVRMYRQMGEELVENVRMLYEQVDAQYVEGRPSEERVGHQIAVGRTNSYTAPI